MSDNLSSLTRRLVVGALPPEATAEQRTDTELVLFLVGEASARKSAQPATNGHSTEAILKALSGEQPITVPDHLRRVVDEALELRKRCDGFASQLEDARKALSEVRGSGRDALTRAVRLAIDGTVADELPPGPMRTLLQDVAALALRVRAAEEASARASDAERRLAEAERVAAEQSRRAAEAEARAQAVEARAAKAPKNQGANAEEVQRLQEELTKLERADKRRTTSMAKAIAKAEATAQGAEAKAKAAYEELAQTRTQLEEARAAIDLARQALKLPAGTGVEDLIATLQERFVAAPPSRPAKPKARDTIKVPKVEVPPPPPPPPEPPPEPPPMHEAHWHEMVDGDLALDRSRYRSLRSKAARVGAERLTDDDRRILVLRVGDQLTWLRADGLFEDGVNVADSPRWQATKRFSAGSGKALVIAEGVTGGQVEIADAWQEWLRAAEVAPGLDVVLDDSHALSPAEEEA